MIDLLWWSTMKQNRLLTGIVDQRIITFCLRVALDSDWWTSPPNLSFQTIISSNMSTYLILSSSAREYRPAIRMSTPEIMCLMLDSNICHIARKTVVCRATEGTYWEMNWLVTQFQNVIVYYFSFSWSL